MSLSPEISRALGKIMSAATYPAWRDRPEFDGLSDFILDVGSPEPSWDDDDSKVLAAFAGNPDRVEQIRKLAAILDEAGWHGDVAGAAKTLGFEFP